MTSTREIGSVARAAQGKAAQGGAALLAAMLTVTLVATFAAAALWQQWRTIEVESSERARVQANWVLVGALDWARLILREDARTGGPDYLSEPWSVPLKEARLSTFLAADKDNTDIDNRDAFLSGQIVDLQSRMNITNLVDGGRISPVALAAFGKLFELQGIPTGQLQTLAENYRFALDKSASNGSSTLAPLPPQRLEDLVWLGLAPSTIDAIRPYVTILPTVTAINLNTASAEVIYATVPGLDLAGAKSLVNARGLSHFKSLADATKILGEVGSSLNDTQQTVSSKYFEVNGRLRLEQTVVVEKSVVYREGLNVVTLSRTKAVETAFPSLQ